MVAGALDWPGYAYIGDGRWDDPHGHFRVLYFGSSAVAAYLEVLAHYRAAPGLDAELDDIVVDEIDEEQAPTFRRSRPMNLPISPRTPVQPPAPRGPRHHRRSRTSGPPAAPDRPGPD